MIITFVPFSHSLSLKEPRYANEDHASPKRLDLVRDKLRLKHDSIRTEDAYLDWIRRVIIEKCH